MRTIPTILPRQSSRALLVILFFCIAMTGCGGGGTVGGGQTPPPAQDFTIGVSPGSATIPAGSSTTVSVSITALNGLSSQVTIQVAGLPSGVSASPSSFALAPGASQPVTLTATSGAAAGSVTATFTGTFGSLSHSAGLGVTVTRPVATLSTRTRYVRTDAAAEYFLNLNTHWVVYDPPTARFFVTDPGTGTVFVIDSATQKQISTISVPGAYGIDETPDHTTLYIGTIVGDLYSIDPVAMQVKQRYQANQIGPFGYQPSIALVLSDGRLALLGSQGGSIDGVASIAIWNPTNNAITIYGGADFADNPVPTTPLCGTGFNIGGFALTADRTSILMGTVSGNGFCELNATTGSFQTAGLQGRSLKIAASPDGRYFVFPSLTNGDNNVYLYDAHTLSLAAQFPVAGDVSTADDLMFSPDSQTLYVCDQNFVYAYSVTTHQQTGWLPNLVVEPSSGGFAVGPITGPNYGAFDASGILFGPMEEGVGFIDTTSFRTGPLPQGYLNAYVNPATGPVSGGTQVQWPVFPQITAQSTIYFGATPAPTVSVSGDFVTATSPAGTAGPVDIYAFANDGGIEVIPEAFSYGPTILEVTPNSATVDGGGQGVVYGYGFGSTSATTIPTNLSVTVGGKAATIIGFNPNAYDLLSPPFLLQSVFYTIPAGTTGTVDVTVTSSSGSGTASAAMTYLPAPQQFPLPGSVLAQGIYDKYRDLYYFTDSNLVQVFSLTMKKWLSPISIPAPSGATQRLWGLSLSPDGSKLAIADIKAGAIYLVNPSQTSSVQTFPIVPANIPQGLIVTPVSVAITDSGVAYITTLDVGGTGFSNFFKLDTNSGTLTNYQMSSGSNDNFMRSAVSSDNSRVYFNESGFVFAIDTASDEIFPGTAGGFCCSGDNELTLSANQTNFEASSSLFDSDLNAQAFFSLNDRELLDLLYVYGSKLSPDGSLLFQPSTIGIDVIDGHNGHLRNRIAFALPLSQNYDALVSDGHDNVLLGIAGANGDGGVAILDLSSVIEPSPLLFVTTQKFLPGMGLTDARHSVRKEGDSAIPHPGAAANPIVPRRREIQHVTAPARVIPK
jgi:hypothetical protein